jgi:hypothetical protein
MIIYRHLVQLEPVKFIKKIWAFNYQVLRHQDKLIQACTLLSRNDDIDFISSGMVL